MNKKVKKTVSIALAAAMVVSVFGSFSAAKASTDPGYTDLVSAIQKNCRDITDIKKALVKIIRNLRAERERLMDEIERLREQCKKCSQENAVPKQIRWERKTVSHLKTAPSKASGKHCKKVVKYVVDPEQIKYSYQKYAEPKKFKINASKVYVYNYPTLKGSRVIGEMKRGEEFVADMFTWPGWVHVKDYGWVRGFKLHPKVLYNPEKVMKDKKRSAYKKVVETVCDTDVSK